MSATTRVSVTKAFAVLPTLVWNSKHHRDGGVHAELTRNEGCACAFHPMQDGRVEPHWHACEAHAAGYEEGN